MCAIDDLRGEVVHGALAGLQDRPDYQDRQARMGQVSLLGGDRDAQQRVP